MRDKEYIQKLEDILGQIIKPLKSIPFKVVIKSLGDVEVLSFDKDKKENKELLEMLINVAEDAKKEINNKGIKSDRVNEVGNKIESFIKNSLIKNDFKADIPKTKNRKKKVTGYPDLEFKDKNDRWHYLECKTYNIKNINTTQRNFYLSPSDNFKVIRDSFHFVIAFEIVKIDSNTYKVNNYKLLSIENFDVDLKNEFNTDNARLFSKENILYENKI